MESNRLSFIIQATYDVLPSPINLQLWFGKDPSYPLCTVPATLQHILVGCRTSHTQGRYTWRHNQVLGCLAEKVEFKRKSIITQPFMNQEERQFSSTFVREGDKLRTSPSTPDLGPLKVARDWQMQVDLDQRLIFPTEISNSQKLAYDRAPPVWLSSLLSPILSLLSYFSITFSIPLKNLGSINGKESPFVYFPLSLCVFNALCFPDSFTSFSPAFVLSCVFPKQPLYGDVSVSSLHSGGQAFFSCLTGYKLQGSSVLTCRNSRTPYWSGKEPKCLAACGGLVRNITVGRIVSPGFPSNYSNNLTCHWLLEAPEGQRLHIHFEKVALAEDDDRLLIKNGNSINAAVLYDSYEVEYLPNEGLLSTSRQLFIELTTDATGTSTAFAAGHCYEPFVKYGNMTSTDNTWSVGAVVEFACDPGYTLEQGSVTIECMDPNNPQWNETEPACRAVCSGEITDSAGVVLSPNWPESYDKGQDCIWGIHVEEDKRIMLDIQVYLKNNNDLLTFYDGDDLTAKLLGQYGGSKSRFKLYTSTADVTIQFQSDPATNVYGYGNGFVVHFFEVARNDTCPELPEISNGWKSTSHPELVQGTVVTYQCYPGYQVVGSELLMCQWDLTWSGDLPSCERVVSCTDPGKVEHSRRVLSGTHFTVGSTIQYICNKGFTLSGNSLLTCFSRGSSGPRWSQKLPRCLPETFEPCNHPGTPTYGMPSSNKLHFQAGETLHYSCQNGHQLLGEPLLYCVPGHPSQWSGLPPVCKGRKLQHDLFLHCQFIF
uniref:Seizure related 6 homolog n=1 Tax=Haplochromis burtoni TaxID=8153 RepID=A0A3Q2V7G0_HAPBU